MSTFTEGLIHNSPDPDVVEAAAHDETPRELPTTFYGCLSQSREGLGPQRPMVDRRGERQNDNNHGGCVDRQREDFENIEVGRTDYGVASPDPSFGYRDSQLYHGGLANQHDTSSAVKSTLRRSPPFSLDLNQADASSISPMTKSTIPPPRPHARAARQHDHAGGTEEVPVCRSTQLLAGADQGNTYRTPCGSNSPNGSLCLRGVCPYNNEYNNSYSNNYNNNTYTSIAPSTTCSPCYSAGHLPHGTQPSSSYQQHQQQPSPTSGNTSGNAAATTLEPSTTINNTVPRGERGRRFARLGTSIPLKKRPRVSSAQEIAEEGEATGQINRKRGREDATGEGEGEHDHGEQQQQKEQEQKEEEEPSRKERVAKRVCRGGNGNDGLGKKREPSGGGGGGGGGEGVGVCGRTLCF